MITKNFRLNALANQYAAALYNHITATSGGEFFTVDTGGESIRVNIVGGVRGVRDLIDGYALEALKEHYPACRWESVGVTFLSRCVNAGGLTDTGIEIWDSMINDMGATVAGGEHA
ncbi:hypothetical protein LG71_03475 [Pluralibacter gergoviae]|uniref:hypothetical protein n=1 Tax=Pluralibacter gergoviae TaxID=61647 RepID=UPI0004F82EE9|nr:hypothetical protein [Pluralibacter gergoviae]AIQ99023.1 hypothetical protein LG71_03475 [Pluralibacter gergoviae]MCV7760780.1 hypothetical protein [Pluralibacter gergoviae]